MSTPASGSVQRHLIEMIRVEHGIEDSLKHLREHAKAGGALEPAIKRFEAMSRLHKDGLEDRLQHLRAASDMLGGQEDSDLSAALARLYGAFSHAALDYAILRALAHRSFDREGAGNTRDLAQKHIDDYAQAMTDIAKIIADAVVGELDSTGEECKCQCTTCALGICTCAPMGVGRTHKEWLDKVSSGALGTILVTAPRKDSAAARAGFRSGDVILAADGQDIHANQELHAAIKKHQAGENILLKVRRSTGEVETVTMVC